MMKIKILGAGCTRCESLERLTRRAVAELHLDASIEKVGDIREILKYPVIQTPALVIDEEVVLVGEVPSQAKLKILLTEHKTEA